MEWISARAPITTELPSDLPAAIRHAKAQLRDQVGDLAGALAEVEGALRAEVAAVVAEREAGHEIFPIVRFADIAAGSVPEETVASIRRRGCAVVKATFPRARAEQWNRTLTAYLEDNRFAERYRGPADDVFGGLASGKPQIYGVYWSKPQIEARQDENMVAVRSFLNSFWRHESEGRKWFDPTGGVSPGPSPSGCRRTATMARSSDGCCPPTRRSSATSSPADGATTTRGTPLIAPRSTSSRRR